MELDSKKQTPITVNNYNGILFINILIPNTFYFLCTVLQEGVATLSGTIPGLMAESDQEEEAEGIYFFNNYIQVVVFK